ncbi:Zinc finger, LSD1-type, partial [Dillenia turbinata]
MESSEFRSIESKESEKVETPIETDTETNKIAVKNSSSEHSITAQMEMEEREKLELDLEKQQQEGVEWKEDHVVGDEDDDDDDGPPPGWESQSLILASSSSSPKLDLDFEKEQVELLGMELELGRKEDEEDNDDNDDGPPPGWESNPITYPPSPSLSPHSPSIQTPVHSSPKTPDLPSTQTIDSMEMDEKHVKDPKLDTPPVIVVFWTTEMGQLVCGSCRQLLAYPKPSKHVKCSCCQTINFVLQAHEVGQVKCGNCEVLLMYPYGAPSVRCSSCHFVTEIGEHNKRPPLSVQQEKLRSYCRKTLKTALKG